MRATCWTGRNSVDVQEVPDPTILNDRDAIVRITSTAICGSDLHLYDGYIPTMEKGDILGHEFMGEVVELGSGVGNLAVGDRVVVPFPIACGACYACEARSLLGLREHEPQRLHGGEALRASPPAGIFGYSHMLGGYAGGQAEYARVPFADVGPIKIENDDLTDEQVLFLSDIFPTGYMGAEMCDIKPGDVVAVWGAGPVGQFAIASAYLLGAERVIAIDRFDYRLAMAARAQWRRDHQLRGGRRPRRAPGDDRRTWARRLHRRRRDGGALRPRAASTSTTGPSRPLGWRPTAPGAARRRSWPAATAAPCRSSASTAGSSTSSPIGSWMNRSLTHAHRSVPRPAVHAARSSSRIERGEIDPSFVVTHRLPLDQAPRGYETFKNKEDNCVKVVLSP